MVNLKVNGIEVGKQIGETPRFRAYLGIDSDGDEVILKVAKTFEDNDVLMKEASAFAEYGAYLEEIGNYQKMLNSPDAGYDLLFAKLENSFEEPSQDDRRINVFSVVDANLEHLASLSTLEAMTRIDDRTSAWILGRFLKLYGFLELIGKIRGEEDLYLSSGYYPEFSFDNFLINVGGHRLVYWNYSEWKDGISPEFKMVRKIYDWVDWDKGSNSEYKRFLADIMRAHTANMAENHYMELHEEFYKLVKVKWGISYYPFTYRERNGFVWNSIDGREKED